MIHRMIVLAILLSCLLPCMAAAGDWKLVWADEFDKPGLPDPVKWGYEVGFVRNDEVQYYTRGRLENARVERGLLVIEGLKDQYKVPAEDRPFLSNDKKNQAEEVGYTSASLITQTKASWKYGRVEVKARVPAGPGVWPAIWMLGDNIKTQGWPFCGEIDIMEFVWETPDTIYGTVHYPKDGKHQSNGGKKPLEAPYKDFHLYAMEWTPDQMDFFLDGEKYHSFKVADADNAGQNPFRNPQYLILNLALGGSWGGKIDDSIFPAKFLIEYVRIYERKTE